MLHVWLKSKAKEQETPPPPPNKPHYSSDQANLITQEQAEQFIKQDFSKADDIFNEPSHGLKQATRNVLRHVVAVNQLAQGEEVSDHEIDRKVIAHHVAEAKKTIYENLGRQHQAQSATQRLLAENQPKTLPPESISSETPEKEAKPAPEPTDFQKQSVALNILSSMMENSFNLEEFKGQSPETGYSRF